MYNKLFTLSDLFHNKELKDVLPQISISEHKKEDYQAKTYRVRGFNSVDAEIMKYTKIGATPYMKNIKMTNEVHINVVASGTLRKHATLQQAYESVLSILQGASSSLSLLGSYGDVITDVFKKMRKDMDFRLGRKQEPKLYLRITSLNEIKNMNKQQKDAFLKNVVENIYFSDDFKEYREPELERHDFIVNNRNVIRGYDSLKRDFDRKVRY